MTRIPPMGCARLDYSWLFMNIHEATVRLVVPVRLLSAGEVRPVGVAGQSGNKKRNCTFKAKVKTRACDTLEQACVCLSENGPLRCSVHEGGHRYSRWTRNRARERGQRWRTSDSLLKAVSDEKWSKRAFCVSAVIKLKVLECSLYNFYYIPSLCNLIVTLLKGIQAPHWASSAACSSNKSACSLLIEFNSVWIALHTAAL